MCLKSTKPLSLLLTVLYSFLYTCQAQTLPAPPVSLAPSDNQEPQILEVELQKLSKQVMTHLAHNFGQCIHEKDKDKDWNETFGFSSDTKFLDNCFQEQGDVGTRLCWQAEIVFYFKNLYRDGQLSKFLLPNINCNLSTPWVSGCNAGWACSAADGQVLGDGKHPNEFPERTEQCQPCCAGFFCPSGITCMIPCPLGAYCPVAEVDVNTSFCEPYEYQIAAGLNGNQSCGSADKWADVGSTECIFCPPGYYCPSTIEKVNCSDGNYCRMGSISPSKCLFRGRCNPNEKKENILLVGVFIMVALSVVLLIMYNFSGQFLTFRERREAKSRERALKRLKEHMKARRASQRWREAFKSLTQWEKKILGPITGKFIPGRVTAVMGPSGAGKTTFLNAVAGIIGKTNFLDAVAGKIIGGCRVTGSVLVNGKIGNIRSYKRIIGFVPQDDIVHGDLTVEENLWFSASCRLPAKMSQEGKIMVVERVMESLGLQGIRYSRVGTVENRGISGGQRKRVNIGLEMVIEPSLLILDEPTSGLDSAASSLLLKALKDEALQGVNIVAVIHQPSYTLYKMFDELILLARGGITVYHGSIEEVEGYFSMLGINVPDRTNPPDYFIDVLKEGIDQNQKTSNNSINIKQLPLRWILYNGYEVPKDMQEELDRMDVSSILESGEPSVSSEGWENVRYVLDGEFRKTPGILMQYRYYLGRAVKQRLRDAKVQTIDYLILGLAGTCLGMIARLSDTNFGIPGYIYTIIAISLLCKVASLRSFSQDQLQFWRERQSGMSSLAYFLSKDTVDHFNTVVKPVVYLSMFYFFNNPRSTFIDNYMVMVALVYCVTGVGYTFAICFQLGSAQLWCALLPVVLTLLSTQQGTPQFLAHLCYPKWALEAFVIANARRYTGSLSLVIYTHISLSSPLITISSSLNKKTFQTRTKTKALSIQIFPSSASSTMRLKCIQPLFLLLALSLFLYTCQAQVPPAPPLSQVPPAPPVSLPPLPPPVVEQLAKLETDLENLTSQITQNLAQRFSFCISDPVADWNETFSYSSDTFLDNCLQEQVDLSLRICTQSEIKFYFNSLFGTAKMNTNCNLTSWVPGCNSGWACAASDQQTTPSDSKYRDIMPKRTEQCQPCCEGFFCPRSITCMMPCPLGAYCPVAKLNDTTGVCDPYDYQIPFGNKSNCGSADKWADVGSTESIFCPPGYYCPSSIEKVNCSDGHFCRTGSISEEKCLFKSQCDPNSPKDNILPVGIFMMVALSVLLLIFYNFSGIFLALRERRKAKSRESAAKMAKESIQAREKWKIARDIAKKSVTQFSRTFSRRRRSVSQDLSSEEPKTLLNKPIEMSDASASAANHKKKRSSNVYENMEEIQEIERSDSEMSSNNGDKGKENGSKRKHRQTQTLIFKNAYDEIEKEKAFQQDHQDLSFSQVFNMAMSEQKRKATRPLLEVAFKDLTLTLGKKKLLRSITGKLIPGRVTAVMGPSGAGKTTFLNAVAGKLINGCKVTGSVLVNGKVGNIRSYKKIIGFVPQDDIVHGDLTVEENLWFSARCRQSKNMPQTDRILVMERVIESLGLQAIRSSRVGTVEKRGISGGQRKRVNVGLEMVMEPSLLILDEPTSGLDSASSLLLLRALRREALEGVNIAAVIHQPSYTLYRMFDDFILLAKGGLTVYHGSIEKVEGYFSMLGMNVPDRVNPPDYFIDVLEGITKPSSNINIKHLPLKWILYNGYEVPKDMQDDLAELDASSGGSGTEFSSARSEAGEQSGSGEVWGNVRYSLDGDHKKKKDLSRRVTPGILVQYRYYLGRVVKQRLRDAKGQAIDYLILGLAGTCLGIIARLGDANFGIPGYIYTIIAISLLCKIASLRSFSQDQLQYWRERQSGMSSLAYFLSKDTVDHFNTVVKPVVYLSMFYFFNNPRSTFADNYIVMIALVYCVTGVGYMFAICFQPGSAQLWSALLPVVLTLLSTQQTTPKFLANLCYPKWALEAFVIANAKKYSGVWLITRCAILQKQKYDINHWGLCLGVLFGYGLFFRIIAFVFLVLLKKK
ncbi:hypothetical protein LUZ60_016161 [Juncus effusus]|nr:hypothetical protein LUZ60_016161 [Juncus effusus]